MGLVRRSSSSRWASPTAVYLEEYADRRSGGTALIEVNIQNLAAVPSIVYGILGLAFIVRGPAAASAGRPGSPAR